MKTKEQLRYIFDNTRFKNFSLYFELTDFRTGKPIDSRENGTLHYHLVDIYETASGPLKGIWLVYQSEETGQSLYLTEELAESYEKSGNLIPQNL